MFCTKCGKQIYDDADYCNYCGNKVKVEDKAVEKVEDKTSRGICLLLLTIGSSASFANIVKFLIKGKDIGHIFGQAVFLLIFIISTIFFLKSRKIGGGILISFVSFEMMTSLYYYYYLDPYPYRYLMKNLLVDEIFYLTIILLLIANWKNLKWR